jgi:hypothetical protein
MSGVNTNLMDLMDLVTRSLHLYYLLPVTVNSPLNVGLVDGTRGAENVLEITRVVDAVVVSVKEYLEIWQASLARSFYSPLLGSYSSRHSTLWWLM